MHYDQPILLHKSSLLQKLTDYVRAGFTSYTSGYVRSDRAAAWVRKAIQYYRVDLGADRNQRARAKAAGKASAVMLMYESKPGSLAWFLLLSPGSGHPARQLEVLKDALDRRQRLVFDGLELIRHRQIGCHHTSFSWRLTSPTYKVLRETVIDRVRRGNDADIRQLIHSLYRYPGFSPIRRQVGKCVALLREQWRRAHGKRPLPVLPSRLPYVNRLRCSAIPLSAWLRSTKLADRNRARDSLS